MPFNKKGRTGSAHAPTAKDFAISAATTAVSAGCPQMIVADKAGKIAGKVAKDVSKSLIKEGFKALAKQTIKAARGDEDYKL